MQQHKGYILRDVFMDKDMGISLLPIPRVF